MDSTLKNATKMKYVTIKCYSDDHKVDWTINLPEVPVAGDIINFADHEYEVQYREFTAESKEIIIVVTIQ